MPLEATAAEHLPNAATFARVLAALTQAEPKPAAAPSPAPPGWLEELDEDVALLSYERALKAHGRCRPESAAGTRTPQLPVTDSGRENHPPDAQEPEQEAEQLVQCSTAGRVSKSADDGRKRASVTVRMSIAECGQLQRRSAEAGLTVSAYLRSCAFEVESLRAQVKQALTELRAAELAAKEPARRSRPWWSRIFRRAAAPQPA